LKKSNNIVHVHIVLGVSVGIGYEGGRVYDTFVEDESVAFGVRGYFELFGGWISVEVGVDDGDVTAFLERLCDLVEEVLSHEVIVELSGTSDVEREPSDFAADFALLGFVPIIFGSSGSEFGDEVSVIEFVGHFTEIVSELDVGLTWFGGVDDGISVKIEDSLLELVQVAV